jgi:short-subunit dehydrogenase
VTALAGARVLVTGASSGIGLATARRLRQRGAVLTLSASRPGPLSEVAAALGADWVAADLGSRDGLDVLLHRARADSPDVVVHAAGIGLARRADETSTEEALHLLRVNVLAALEISAVVLPAMRSRRHGHLVFLGSVAGALGVADEAVYSASKAALAAYAGAVGLEGRAHGIRVTSVLPGAVDTPFFARRGRPYGRTFPRALSADHVAARTVRAVEHDRAEVVVPAWLRAPIVLRAIAPGAYARLAARLG